MIQADGLTRVLDCQRVQEYSLSQGNRIFHFPNASSFSRCPEVVLLCFISDKRHVGVNIPRMVFTHFGLETLSITRNGLPYVDNEFTRDMDLDNIDSPHVDHFYRKLVRFFRPHAEKSVSRLRFFSEMFLICIEPASIPRTLFPEDTSDTVNLSQTMVLDVNLSFKAPLQENVQMFLISFDKIVAKIGAQGDIVES